MASPTDPTAITGNAPAPPTGTIFDQIHTANGGTVAPTGTIFDQIHAQAQQQQPSAPAQPAKTGPAPVNPGAPSQLSNGASPGGFASNLLSSGGRFLGGLCDAAKLGAGAGEKLLNYASGGAGRAITGGELPEEQQFDSVAHQVLNHPGDTAAGVGNYLSQRYGGVDAIKRTAYEDPVGFAADLSTVLGGGATALKVALRVGQIAKIGRTADVLSDLGDVAAKASTITNPLTLPTKLVQKATGGAAAALYQGHLKPPVANGLAANRDITQMGLDEAVPLTEKARSRLINSYRIPTRRSTLRLRPRRHRLIRTPSQRPRTPNSGPQSRTLRTRARGPQRSTRTFRIT